jgi:hypothetical protein
VKVLTCGHINDIAILKLENDLPLTPWTKLRIDGDEYDPCFIMDAAPNVIGVKSPEDFNGHDVQFIDKDGNER